MYIIELARQIMRDMAARKVRSGLAMFGIFWGTLSVIILLALGHGFYHYNRKNLLSITDGTILFWTGARHKNYKGLPKGSALHLKVNDIMNLKRALPAIARITPRIKRYHQAFSYHEQKMNGTVVGVAADFDKIKQVRLSAGRFLNALDVRQHLKVVVLGSEFKSELFGQTSAIGKAVYFQGVPFTVIGVLGNDPVHGRWLKRHAYIPYTTATDLWGRVNVENFMVIPKNINHATQLIQQIRDYLGYRYHFSPKDKDALMVFNVTKLLRFFLWFFLSIEIFLGACGFMTLAVGAVGVANVLFLIVSERTAEFGLRMAIGAKPKDILGQVLLEALLIVFLAGGLGIVVSAVCISFLQMIPLPTWIGVPDYSWQIMLITVVLLGMVAMLAGIFPARRAAKMMPVEALSF